MRKKAFEVTLFFVIVQVVMTLAGCLTSNSGDTLDPPIIHWNGSLKLATLELPLKDGGATMFYSFTNIDKGTQYMGPVRFLPSLDVVMYAWVEKNGLRSSPAVLQFAGPGVRWWRQLMAMDTGNAMNEIQGVANSLARDRFNRDNNQEVFNRIFDVYNTAKKIEVRFAYDESKDQDFKFQPSFTPAGQAPYVDWAELERANVRTAIGALWDVSIDTQLTPEQSLQNGQVEIFARLSYLYFQMKLSGD